MITIAQITTGELVGIVSAAVIAIIGALTTGVIAIINATKQTRDAVNGRMSQVVSDMKSENAKLLETAVENAFNKGVKQAADTLKAVQPLAAPAIPAVKIVNSPHEPVPTIVKKP